MSRPIEPTDVSFVYVIGHDSGPQKVGYSISPSYRATTLKVAGQPHFTVHYRAEVRKDEARGVEALAHHYLAASALGSERFDVTPAVAWEAIQRAVEQYREGVRAPKISRKPDDEKCTQRLGIILTKSLVERIDDLRRIQRPIPSFGSMVKQLVSEQLDRDGIP